jgi:hypothetical protein
MKIEIYDDMINQFIPEHPAMYFQKIIISKGCHGTLHYKECEQCKSDDDYVFLHFNITGSMDICIGKVEK